MAIKVAYEGHITKGLRTKKILNPDIEIAIRDDEKVNME